MKRVSSQSVTMKLLPGTSVGTSIIELSIKQDKPVHGSISFDNSGLESTGVYQGSFTSSLTKFLELMIPLLCRCQVTLAVRVV